MASKKKPRASATLQRGDLIGVVAPGFAVRRKSLNEGVARLERAGYRVRLGTHLLARLAPLTGRFPIVGDVRGSGLFIGVELVRDPETLEPAEEEAAFVVDRMRELGVLAGTDGPYHNVVKIRPPMPFTTDNADQLVSVLTRVLEEEFGE